MASHSDERWAHAALAIRILERHGVFVEKKKSGDLDEVEKSIEKALSSVMRGDRKLYYVLVRPVRLLLSIEKILLVLHSAPFFLNPDEKEKAPGGVRLTLDAVEIERDIEAHAALSIGWSLKKKNISVWLHSFLSVKKSCNGVEGIGIVDRIMEAFRKIRDGRGRERIFVAREQLMLKALSILNEAQLPERSLKRIIRKEAERDLSQGGFSPEKIAGLVLPVYFFSAFYDNSPKRLGRAKPCLTEEEVRGCLIEACELRVGENLDHKRRTEASRYFEREVLLPYSKIAHDRSLSLNRCFILFLGSRAKDGEGFAREMYRDYTLTAERGKKHRLRFVKAFFPEVSSYFCGIQILNKGAA